MNCRLIFIVICLMSCTDTGDDFVHGTFGPQYFSSEFTYAAYNGSLLVVTAEADSLTLRILIAPVSEPDSFTMRSEDTLYVGSQVALDVGDQRYRSYDGSGSVVIQRINARRARGNFSGRLVNADAPSDTLAVIEGKFDVEIDSDDPS